MICAFRQVFMDNSSYRYFDKLPYMDSLAYTVQEFLCSDKITDPKYRLNGRIRLCDFMTLVVNFIIPACTELGKTTIKEHIAALREKKEPRQNKNTIEYTKEDGLLVTNATQGFIVDILWAAYIYTYTLSDFHPEDERPDYNHSFSGMSQEPKWFDASLVLNLILIEELHDAFIFSHPLTLHNEEACQMMRKHILKNLQERKREVNVIAEKPVQIPDDDNETLRAQIEELKTEKNHLQIVNDCLRTEIEQLKQASQTSQENPEIHKAPTKELNTNIEEMLVELLKPAFYNIEDDARDFLRRINGLDNQGVTDVARQFVKDKKITPSKKGRFIWQYLHAAKLYHATEQNWTAAMRKIS